MINGKSIVDLALKHLGEEYRLGVQVPKDDPAWTGPWDCAEFASWLYYQLIGEPFGWADPDVPPALGNAYTGAWARDSKRLRTDVAVAAGIPGAFILRYNGKEGHIVISDGAGGTVEAMNRRAGVTRARLGGRRFDFGILPPGVEYEGGEISLAQPITTIYRLAVPYMKGPVVRAIQRRLAEQNFRPGEIDGVYGAQTELAVREFQAWRGIVVDGEVGSVTAALLPVIL